MLRIGFGRTNITPRLGVELSGYGPFLCRRAASIHDPLYARAMAAEGDGGAIVIVSCDLVAVTHAITQRVRELVYQQCGVRGEAVMVHCTHTHSGPSTGASIGWGEPDPPYVELLPGRIAAACVAAVHDLHDAALSYAEPACEGIGLNREYERFDGDPHDVVRDDWRPARPELTDTTCRVLTVRSGGRLRGVLTHFGCHPVVCRKTHAVHGDFCGVAMGRLEREHPGATFMFLQGALGDINACLAVRNDADFSRSLDIVAGRLANAVRSGIARAGRVKGDRTRHVRKRVAFSRKAVTRDRLRELLAEQENVISAPGATDASNDFRMAVMRAVALRGLIERMDAGESLRPEAELQGLRVGPVSFLGAPFEVFQAIKNDVLAGAALPAPLVLSHTNESFGYAIDAQTAERGGYAADLVPLIKGDLPFANVHAELARGLVDLDAALQG